MRSEALPWLIGAILLVVAAFLRRREKAGASKYPNLSRYITWIAIAIMAKDAFEP